MKATTVGERLQRAHDLLRLADAVLRVDSSRTAFAVQGDLEAALLRLVEPAQDDLFWIREATSERFNALPAPTDDERNELAAERQARKLKAVDAA